MKKLAAILSSLLFTACNEVPPRPVTETATFNGNLVTTSGHVTKDVSIDLNVDRMMLCRDRTVDPEGSLLLVLIHVKNRSVSPLSLDPERFTVVTDSGKIYSGERANRTGATSFPANFRKDRRWAILLEDIGPDISEDLLLAFRIPYDGIQEPVCLALGTRRLILLRGTSWEESGKWSICESPTDVKGVYDYFPYLLNK